MSENTFSKNDIETVILCSLTVGDKYGYEIASEINAATQTEIKQPTLYNYLKKLESNGLIESYWGDESNGGRRKYFKITDSGAESLKNFGDANISAEKMAEQFSATGPNAAQNVINSVDNAETPLKAKQDRKKYTSSVNEQINLQMQLDDLMSGTGAKAKTFDDSQFISAVDKEEYIENDAVNNTVTDPPIEQRENKRHSFFNSDTLNEPAQENLQNEKIDEINIEEKIEPEYFANQAKPEQNRNDDLEFYAKFEEKLNEKMGAKQPKNPNKDKEDNYKHIIGSLLGKQLEDESLKELSKKPEINLDDFSDPNLTALENTAEKFAEKGIRINFYNKETAYYRPQAMLYKNKINFFVGWITYGIYLIETFVLWLFFKDALSFSTVGYFWAACAIVPVTLSLIFAINPTLKRKPNFKFNYHFTNAWIVFILLTILDFAFNVLFLRIVFTDVTAVLIQIVLPLITALSLPWCVLFYKAIFKKMLV